MNDICQPSNSVMYGKVPQYNETLTELALALCNPQSEEKYSQISMKRWIIHNSVFVLF